VAVVLHDSDRTVSGDARKCEGVATCMVHPGAHKSPSPHAAAEI